MAEVVIHPIYSLQKDLIDGGFDLSLLPFEVYSQIFIEDLTAVLPAGTFELWRKMMGEDAFRRMTQVKYGLIRRFDNSYDLHKDVELDQSVGEPVEVIMALLRLIRPMRERVGLMSGDLRINDTADIRRFSSPYDLMEVPEVEKLYSFRTSDALMLQQLAGEMLRAM